MIVKKKTNHSGWRAAASCLAAAGLCMSAATAQAGHAKFTFDEDPTGYLDFLGNSEWSWTGGNPGGYLVLFRSVNSQRGTIIFDDFDAGMVVKGYTFTCDIKAGDGTGDANPADGFSVNYAHTDDPVILAHDGSGFASSPGNEGNLPEEGTQTGLAVGFDAWDSGSGDIIGMSVRVDNKLLTQIPMPTKNGTATDATSLQTGPRGDGTGDSLSWCPLKLEMVAGGNLNVWWKNQQVLTNYATGFRPGTGRLIFAGRTGGNNQNVFVDNIEITTVPADGPSIAASEGTPQGVRLALPDVGAVSLNPSSVVMTLDGVSVTPVVSKIASTNYVTYVTAPASYFAFGSTHSVNLQFKDSNGRAANETVSVKIGGYPFTGWPLVNPNDAGIFTIEAEDFNFSSGGFIDNPKLASAAASDNYINRAGVPFVDEFCPNTNGNHIYRTWDGAVGEPIGTEATGDILRQKYVDAKVGDAAIADYNVGWVDDGEWLNFTRTFPAGKYRVYARMATGNGGPFNISLSKVTSDPTLANQTTAPLGKFAMVGTGNWQSYKSFPLVDGFGNEVVLPFGGKETVRFTHTSGGINWNYLLFVPATDAGTLRPYVETAYPMPNTTDVLPEPLMTFSIYNRETKVTSSSIKLLVNGTDVSSKIQVTTLPYGASVKYQHTGPLVAGSTNTMAIVYTDDGSVSTTNSWSFVVVDYSKLTTISPALAVPSNLINKNDTGFNLYVHQMAVGRPGADANKLPAPLNQVNNLFIDANTGLPYENLATLTDGKYSETGTINYNIDSTPENPTGGNAAPFGPNKVTPGIPGWGGSKENFVIDAITWLDLKAGTHTFCVNSDDGFIVCAGADAHDWLLTPLGVANYGKGNSEITFTFNVATDGIYPFRMFYWQGGGGGSVMFYSINGNERILINDLSNPNSIKAYRTYTGAKAPYAITATPTFDQGGTVTTGVMPDITISAEFTNLNTVTPVLSLNGVSVPVTKTPTTNGTTTVSYKPTALLLPLSTNTVTWVYSGQTNSYTFVVANYATVPSSQVVIGNPDANSAGILAKIVKANVTGLDNTSARAEAELAGTLTVGGSLVQNLAPAGPMPGGYYLLTNINFNIDANGRGGEQGSFQSPAYPDMPFPAIPGTQDATVAASYENFAAEFLTYVQLPAGFVKMVVNSDDGFRVTVGQNSDTNNLQLGVYEGGKGASDVLFGFVAPVAGWYPIRVIYYQGGGGGNCELFTIADDGSKALVNDLTNPKAVKAYYKVVSTAFTGTFTSTKIVGSDVVITYTSGVLQSAPSISGPWTDVNGASSPYTTPAVGSKFFRLHQ